MTVRAQIDANRLGLTPAGRRVASVVADDPEFVAFATVAGLAGRAGVSGATVVRLATTLGYAGYTELQGAVRDELAGRLHAASARIRRPQAGSDDPLARALAVETANVAATLEGVDGATFAAAVDLLADAPRVRVLSGDASVGVGFLLVGELGLLREGVELVSGSEVRVARALADVGPSDVVVVLDVARYERALLALAGLAADRGARLVTLTDSALSPLAGLATAAFTVATGRTGPFDSHVGFVALVNALTAGVADRRRPSATARLDGVEGAWRDTGVLLDP